MSGPGPRLAGLVALAIGAAALWLAGAPPPGAPPAGLAGQDGASAMRPEQAPADDAAARFVPPPEPAPDLAPFLARPLFSAARRPPPPPPPAPAPPPSGLLFDRWAVAGVVVADGAPLALLRDSRDGALVRLRIGDRLGPGELVAIDLTELTFRVGGSTVAAQVRQDGRGE